MTTGSTDNADAVLLRDLARAGGPDGIARYAIPYPQSDPASPDTERINQLMLWIETVLDRVPEAYGDRDQPEAIIDAWLDDLTNLYDAVGYWRTEYQLGRAGVAVPSTYKAANEALAAAYDRVRTDEEGDTTDG